MLLEWLWQQSFVSASAVFFALNILIFAGALAAGKFIDHFFNPGKENAGRFTATELLLSCSTVCINSAITSGGWLLWKAGVIRLNTQAAWWQILRDTAVLVLAMDLALYILHRIAHIPLFYKIAHYKHHEYKEVTVLTLFVMSPLEALGFGTLWVFTLCFFSFSIEAVALFLNMNLYFGITAHAGTAIYPERLRRFVSALGFTYPDFHRLHHENERVNMGFYTRIWDVLLKTSREAQ
ncbi:MAG: sterol desaturase family protein [Spirochaetes bacterium]|nr:sterol desaturase family protein [Spirochaetota bacterium]